MHVGTDVMGDQSHDTLAVFGRKVSAGIAEACAEPIDPEPTVRVEHHLDDGVVVEPGRYIAAECRPEHAGAFLDHC
jgi:hypothetical protein